MIFANLAQNAAVFLDANTLIYYYGDDPKDGPTCKALIQRMVRLEVAGFTSVSVVSEVAHRLMTLEAMDQNNWPARGIAQRLRQHPAEVQKLQRFRQAVDEIPQLGIQVLGVDHSLASAAAALSQQHGLLTNDALIVAVMQQHGLTHLASNDPDFDRVPGITRYSPS